MNVLSIGNSFAVDAHRYLHQIAKADGVELTTVALDIGGCSLQRHYENMLSGEKVYEMHYNFIRVLNENTVFECNRFALMLKRAKTFDIIRYITAC